MHILLISNRRTDQAQACADALTAAFGGRVSWLPDERRLIEPALSQSGSDSSCRTILLCGGDALGPSIHMTAALEATLQGSLPGYGEALRRQLEASLGTRAMLIQAPAGHIGDTAVFSVPVAIEAVAAAVGVLTPTLDIYHRHLRGEVLPEMPAAAAVETAQGTPEVPPRGSAAHAPRPAQADEDRAIPDGITVAPIPSDEAAPEREQLSSGWRAGLRAIGGRLSGEQWVEIPEELRRIAPAREILERAGQRAAVVLSSGRVMGAFGVPDLQREGSKVLLVGDGAPVAEVIALHRHPSLAGLTTWGSNGLLPSADSSAARLAETRLGKAPPSDGELFAVDHDAVYLQRGSDIIRWDGRSLDRAGTEGQAIASLLLRWSQR